jgi:flagellar biogenesis protein FliO
MMTPELMTAAMKMIGVLVLIVGGLMAFNVYAKRLMHNGGGGLGQKTVQVLESTSVGIKKSVTLVKVPGAVLVLGISQDRITLLDRMDEQTFSSRAVTPLPTRVPCFKDHLRNLSGGWLRQDLREQSPGPNDLKT